MQGQPWLHRESEASLTHMRPLIKQRENKLLASYLPTKSKQAKTSQQIEL